MLAVPEAQVEGFPDEFQYCQQSSVLLVLIGIDRTIFFEFVQEACEDAIEGWVPGFVGFGGSAIYSDAFLSLC